MSDGIMQNMGAAAKIGTQDPAHSETDQPTEQATLEPIELDWNEERAKAWHKMQPPSKPSKSEIDIYKKYFNKKKNLTATPKVLILGSTVEFRQLAFDLGCSVTVVDYSQKYHDIISEDLGNRKQEILDKEQPVYCDWSSMISDDSSNEKAPLDDEEDSFDIIIGDLAIGNVPPSQLDRFFKNVSRLLKNGGYFLGKSIYKFSDFETSKDKIEKKLKEIVDKKITDDSIVYAETMYDLSVFNTDFVGKEKRTRKINFANLHTQINEFVGNDKTRKNIFKIYLGEDTNFKSKMPHNFYIYEYSQILELIDRYSLEISDIEYGNDCYKENYPLLILKKGNSESDNPVSIRAFISNNEKYLEEWRKNITSRFFLINLDQIDAESDRCISIEDIRNRIKKFFNRPIRKDYMQTVEVDDDLNFAITSIEDEAINRETEALIKGTKIETDLIQKVKLKNHFIYAILFYEAYVVNKVMKNPQSKSSDNDIEKLILSELFKDPNSTRVNHVWDPHDSPWVAAKICICLLPLYQQYGTDKKSIIRPYLKQLENVVETISEKINPQDYLWDTEIGSRFDTSSLCLEVLYGYKNCLKGIRVDKDDKRELNTSLIDSAINKVLNKYVLNGKINETFIKFPIYSSLIEQVCANSTINGKPAYKKMCGRIEWYTILYTICKDKARGSLNNEDNKYTVAAKYIAAQLKKFWFYFNARIDDIYEQTKNQEISLIPQIVYCISHSKVLEDR